MSPARSNDMPSMLIVADVVTGQLGNPLPRTASFRAVIRSEVTPNGRLHKSTNVHTVFDKLQLATQASVGRSDGVGVHPARVSTTVDAPVFK
jgi:hypothetical protein